MSQSLSYGDRHQGIFTNNFNAQFFMLLRTPKSETVL